MKSCALLRTNVGLTTNVKLVVGSNYSLYLDSIVSDPELSQNRYKQFQFDKDSYWDDLVPTFFQNTPLDISYKIKYDNDVDNMSNDFANQYDDLYQYGARNIVDNKFYKEEYEYFAPLYINKSKIPQNFVIFRVDGPGILRLGKENFREQILTKLKFVKNFDLTLQTYLGQWLNNSILKNKSYPNNSLYVDFRRLEFSSWKGIDYDRGGYVEKNFFLDSTFEYEQLYSEMEKLILEGYKNNKIIFPNIINFSFLFDDTPATKNGLRKWSLNRYLGFYLDELTLVNKVSPTILPQLKVDVLIDSKNILYSPSSDSPFLNDWEKNEYPYVEIGNVYYKIEKFQQITSAKIQRVKNSNNTYEEKLSSQNVTKYKVISDVSLSGKSYNDMNQNLITVDSDNYIKYQNGNDFTISDFNSADVWLIEIGDLSHNLINEDGKIKIHTDYGFNQSAEKFEYYVNQPNPNYKKSIDLITSKDGGPVEFKIFKCKFTDIKDFDTDITDTVYSKFEYINRDELTDTDEPKMYMEDLDSNSNPKDYVQFKLQNKVVSIPASSEYTANNETFRLVDNSLSNLWRKNSERLKWGLDGSISINDYPYLLNNSLLSEDFNRSPNTKDVILQRDKRNLDHFYTINSATSSYSHHSLHVEDHVNGLLNTNFKFEIDKYLGLSYSLDYFSYFFGKKTYFEGGNVNKKTEKYSYFQDGDVTIPNITYFKGLKFSLSEVENINIVDNKIEKINLKNSNKFDSWKFSILVSTNDYIVTPSPSNVNLVNLIKSENVLKWRIIDEWKHEKQYYSTDIVSYDDVLYSCLNDSRIIEPELDPKTSPDWELYKVSSIFYNPVYNNGFTYSTNMGAFGVNYPPLVFNQNEYYYSDGLNSWDFWDKYLTYSEYDQVRYKGKNWISLINTNRYLPDEDSGYFTASTFINAWEETDLPTRWEKVEIWKSDYEYDDSSWDTNLFSYGNYAIYNDVVYGCTATPKYGVSPNLDSTWNRIYSLVPDTTYLYGPSIANNNIVRMNGKFYQCVSNLSPLNPSSDIFYNFSLDNGIYVIINEKHKNVLINIYVNDNTYSNSEQNPPTIWEVVKNNLENTNRDDIYSTIYSKLSTNNLMNSLNDLSNNFGFSDYVKYIIVGEDSNVKLYDFNDLKSVSGLPYLLYCEPPSELLVRNHSNSVKAETLKPSEIKAKRLLNDSNIDEFSKLNYYNEMSLASLITRNEPLNILVPSYSGLKNDIYLRIYRFSGYYSPILRKIELFDSPSLTQSVTNYKFDTDLTDFGIIKQRVVSKVNKKNNLLRLKNQANLKSIYPMIDEFGYHVVDFFMFKSTWDFEYHYECQEYEPKIEITQIKVKSEDVRSVNFKNNNTNLL